LGGNVGKEWGWIALRGIAAFIFGVLALMWPMLSIVFLAVMWGAFIFADGVFSLMASWELHRQGVRWWPYLLYGLLGLVAGALTLLWPGISAFILVYIIAFWALIGGIAQITAAIRLRKEITDEWSLILLGAISVLFGLLILFSPAPQAVVAIAWMVGIYAMISGILSLMLAFKVRRHVRWG
jgi:uncharacterized membrane protein HdeD (DUF308 family)